MISVRIPRLWVGWALGICLVSSLAFAESDIEKRWPAPAEPFSMPLAYAPPAQYANPFGGQSFTSPPKDLPAESGVNYTLSPWAGYVNLGSGTGGQAAGGASGSVAFPIGHSFGLWTGATAGSIGSNSLYDIHSLLFWRDPSLGLVGTDPGIGHFSGFGGTNFGSGGASFEGFFGRFTPFATVGAFGVQHLAAKGYGSLGTAYYPTDNLQLTLSGYDYGGLSGVSGGIEYLLPRQITSVATTVSVSGSVGNHGTSGAMARLKLLFGPTPANNKTLIERRRQDDPLITTYFGNLSQDENYIASWIFQSIRKPPGSTAATTNACAVGDFRSSGCQCNPPLAFNGPGPNAQCS